MAYKTTGHKVETRTETRVRRRRELTCLVHRRVRRADSPKVRARILRTNRDGTGSLIPVRNAEPVVARSIIRTQDREMFRDRQARRIPREPSATGRVRRHLNPAVTQLATIDPSVRPARRVILHPNRQIGEASGEAAIQAVTHHRVGRRLATEVTSRAAFHPLGPVRPAMVEMSPAASHHHAVLRRVMAATAVTVHRPIRSRRGDRPHDRLWT